MRNLLFDTEGLIEEVCSTKKITSQNVPIDGFIREYDKWYRRGKYGWAVAISIEEVPHHIRAIALLLD